MLMKRLDTTQSDRILRLARMNVLIPFLCLLAPLSISAQGQLQPGTYYIQNVASGTYISSGANWGTRAVLSKHGVDFTVTRNADGTYILRTDLQGAGKALRPSDGYMDQSGNWTVTPLDDGSYALFNGTNYFGYAPENEHPWIPRLDTYTDTSSPNTHWRFLTRDDLMATLKTATRQNPVDATFLIAAPDFLIGDQRITAANVWGPDVTATSGYTTSVYTRNGSNGEVFNKAAFDVYQQLNDIPMGTYSLSVQAFYRYGSISQGATAYNNGTEKILPHLYADDKSEPVVSIYDYRKGTATGGWATSSAAGYIPDNQTNAADCFDSGEDIYLTTIRNIIVSDGRLRVGIRKENQTVANDWCCFDNFTLMYYGADIEALRAQVLKALEDYEALNTDTDIVFQQALDDIRVRVQETDDTDVFTKAYDEMKAAYSIWFTKNEVEDTPIDLSPLMQNLDLANGLKGWEQQTTSNSGFSTTWAVSTSSPYAVEAYAGFGEVEMTSYQLSQKVALSPGMYRFTSNAFYRYGSSYMSDINKGKEISEACIFAGSDSVTVPRLGSETLDTYANSLSEAAEAFAKGLYATQIVFTITQPTTIDIGFQGTHSYLKSWFAAGPCKLEKISQQILDNEADNDFGAKKQKYLLKWNSYTAISQQALGTDTYEQLLDSVKEVLYTVNSDEQLMQIDNQMWKAIKHLIQHETTSTGQFDITPLITNPAFDSGLTGWTVTGNPTRTEVGVVEDFNNPQGDIRQTLADMPAGNYTLKVQAFYRSKGYRQASWDYEDGKDNVAAWCYLEPAGHEGVKQDIRNINDGARVLPARPASDVPGAFGRSIPNTFNGAADAFAMGQYWNILRATTDADTDLTIGVAHDNGQAENWLTYDNFKLYYGAKTIDVNLDEKEKYNITEDTYANVKLNKTLYADRLNAICLPFDVPASYFTEIYNIAGVNYDEEQNSAVAVLVPQDEVKAGHGYFVKVAADTQLQLDDVLLHAEAPDSVPCIWENAALTGAYGLFVQKQNYTLGEDGTLAYKRLSLSQPGYCALLNLPAELTTKLKSSTTIPLENIQYANIQLTLNIEHTGARAFIHQNTYTVHSESVIDKYNVAPQAHRDHPHTAIIPLPDFKGKADVTMSWDAVDPTVVPVGQTAWSFEIPEGSKEVELKNLYPGQAYMFAVTDATSQVVAAGRILTQGQLRMIKTTTGSNIRDLGGWLTVDGGHTNYGLIYRGGEMNGSHVMSKEDISELQRLGINAEVDLRSDDDLKEYTVNGSVFGPQAPYYYANQYNFVEDALQGDTAIYRNAFNLILDNISQGKPVLFHCIWGADRTGALAMLLEGLLGVTLDQLYKDYELTSFSIAGPRHKDGIDSKLEYIRTTFTGSTLQHKFYNYWKDYVRIPAERLDEFIRIMNGCQAVGIHDIADDPTEGIGDDAYGSEVFNLQGQRINHSLQSLPSGIYIIQGRKVMKR